MQPKQQKHSTLRQKLSRTFLATTLLASSQLLYGITAIAAPAPAGEVILNKATGSFEDTDSTLKLIESNVVQVTVAEIAGISVTAAGTTGTPALGSVVYFEFLITNEGNDPTQFFIPGTPTTAIGGTPGLIEIIAYDPDGSGPGAATNLIGAVTPGKGIIVPNTGAATEAITNSNLFNNGSIPVGGTLRIRVPMTVTALGGQPISVKLGDTGAAPNDQNQNYSTTTSGLKDLYTQDNTGTTNGDLVSGLPFNGDGTLHRKEASASQSVTANLNIRGKVFEDVDYGGGLGNPLNTYGTSLRPNALVELYTSSGSYVTSTTTTINGNYTFTNLSTGDFIVRVVNSTVTSSRGVSTGLIPVQTFRTDASVTAGVVSDVNNRVGGEKPSEQDAPANTGSQTLAALNALAGQEVQSLSTVKLSTSDVNGIEFGYNFDTIVNTNDSGQGSLRQFILNSNALPNGSLDQEPNYFPATGTTAINPAPGEEYSIFMIPASAINGTGGNANAAVINLASNFSITDANTHLDATTQTINIGDLNLGTVGTGGTVGVDALPLSTIPKPEVVLNFQNIPTNTNAILVSGANTTLKGFASYGYRSSGGLATLLKGAIIIQSGVTDAGPTTITQLLGGTKADGSDPGVPASTIGYTFQTTGAANISNNYLAYNSDAITFENINGTHVNFINNELAYNGPKDNNGSNASGIYADQMETIAGTRNITLEGNLVRNSSKPNYPSSQGQGIQISNSTFITLKNNTFSDNNVFAINASSSDSLFEKNIITGTKNTGLGYGNGIIVYASAGTGLRNRITQNSIYQNALLGINHGLDGVTPNDGLVNAAQANNGIDYPIITSSTLSGNALSVKGYVGKETTPGAGDSDFANVTVEFFIADDDGNNNGKVFDTDPATVSKPHGEGKTYIGNCTTQANGQFSCTFNNAVTATMASPKNITATATDSAGNTSEFSAAAVNNPNVVLVKRITRVNGKTTSYLGDNLAGYNQQDSNIYDDNLIELPIGNPPTTYPDTDNWPNTTGKTASTFLVGGIDGGFAKPGDEIEYTIYFLSTGDQPAQNIEFCDRIPDHQTFIPNSFSSLPPAPNGLGGLRGISVQQNDTELSYTNIGGDDTARFYDPNGTFPAICNGSITQTENNGAVFVNLGDVPNATAPSTPGSYGFVRFRVKVK